MKRIILLCVFFVTLFGGFVFGADDEINPQIEYVQVEDKVVNVKLTGVNLKKVDSIISLINKKEKESEILGKHKLAVEKDDFIFGKLLLKFKKYDANKNDFLEYKTDVIDIHSQPQDYDFTYHFEKELSEYDLIVESDFFGKLKDYLGEESENDIKVKINEEEIEELENVEWEIESEKMIIKGLKKSDYDNMILNIEIDDMNYRNIYIPIENSPHFSLEDVVSDDEEIYIKIRASVNNIDRFVLGEEREDTVITGENYAFLKDRGKITLPREVGYEGKPYRLLHMETPKGVSQKKLVNFNKALTPVINSFNYDKKELNIYGKNFGVFGTKEYKLFLDEKEYILTGKKYNSRKEKVKSQDKYEGMEDMIGDEKDEKKKDLREELNKSKKIFFDVSIRDYKISVPLKSSLTGEKEGYLKYGDRRSRDITLNFTERTSSIDKSQDNIESLSPEFSLEDGVNTGDYRISKNKEVNFGNIDFSLSNDEKVYIKNVSFVLNITSGKVSSVPVKNVTLGEKEGFIKKNSENEYEVYFQNIIVDNASSLDFDIEFSNDFRKFNFFLKPLDINYSVLKRLEKKNFEQDLSGKKVNGYISLDYTQCFQKDYDYQNCKDAGYDERSMRKWKTVPAEDVSDEEEKEEEKTEDKEDSKQDTENYNEDKNEKEEEKEQNSKKEGEDGGFTQAQKKTIIKFINKIDDFVNNKASSDNQKAKIYKKVYTLLLNHYKNMEKSSNKKTIIAGILHLTKKRYNKFK